MATSDLLAPAAPTPVRHAPVIETGARAGGKYCAGMVLLALPMLLALRDSYWLDVVTVTYLMAGLAGAWNIIGGFGGQFSLGHGVFFAVGAYITAILYAEAGVSPWLG